MYDRKEHILEEELREIAGETTPFHMPGHKRNLYPVGDDITAFDMTEIPGADDLHDADGILKEAMERTAELYHARRTWYLVGGSTVGILAMVRAAVPFGGEIIAARNAHKSFFHIAELLHLSVHFVCPPVDDAFLVAGSTRPEDIEESLKHYPNTSAVYVTSPTYEGVVSDIASIAKICHAHGIPLLVDEAHGAHLGLFDEGGFPAGALSQGADLVVQSAHKTLPSLTQTAFLHLGSERIDPVRIEQQLNVFETSSPSYPLMASLDGCTGILRNRGKKLFAAWKEELDSFDRDVRDLRSIEIMNFGKDNIRNHKTFFAFDRSKILIRQRGKSGAELSEELRLKYGIVLEMATGSTALAMTGCGDREDMLPALSRALHEMDREESADRKEQAALSLPPLPPSVMTIAEAQESRTEPVPVSAAVGQVAASYVYPYPPGVPVIVPGEVVTEESVAYLSALKEAGAKIVNTCGKDGFLLVVCQDRSGGSAL